MSASQRESQAKHIPTSSPNTKPAMEPQESTDLNSNNFGANLDKSSVEFSVDTSNASIALALRDSNPAKPRQKDTPALDIGSGIATGMSSPVSIANPSSPKNAAQLSPGIHSPASSLIFERNVQEDIIPPQASPSIPGHIRTENYIPPVLEASSAAITDDHLDPDSVEIITHNMHHSAAAGVAGTETAEQSMSSFLLGESGTHTSDSGEPPSPYGALDKLDPRRLSFISWADVINSENVESSEFLLEREFSQNSADIRNTIAGQNRSPSPFRSPTTSHGLAISPPLSVSPSFQGIESPNRGGGAGSPLPAAQSPISPSSEFKVETMRQALKKTKSGDMSGARNQVSSTVSNDDVF